MGFSVSGSAAIVFAGLFIAFGTWYGATSNSFERVTDAQQARADEVLEEKNGAIEIQIAVYDDDQDETMINATNNGTTAISLEDTDLLFNNEYQTGWQSEATVEGDANTDLWLPGEKLHYNISSVNTPVRVKFVIEGGVAATKDVSVT